MKNCIHCDKEISAKAMVCEFCGRSQIQATQIFLTLISVAIAFFTTAMLALNKKVTAIIAKCVGCGKKLEKGSYCENCGTQN